MNPMEALTVIPERCEESWYRRASLPGLVQRIVNESDALALREFHDHRRPFHFAKDRALRFVDYLRRLQATNVVHAWSGGCSQVLEDAYDLTVAKFINLPIQSEPGHTGPDCRLYFQAFLKHFARRRGGASARSALEMDALAAEVLQGLVARHFYLSCLECGRRRSRQFIRRLVCKVGKRDLCLWFPSSMTTRQCRAWLNVNLKAENSILGREQVQSLISDRLVRPRLQRAMQRGEVPRQISTGKSLISLPEVQAFRWQGLAQVVAEEKAEHIDAQRPTIRALGRLPLKGLIRRIFEDLSSDQYDMTAVAHTFGLNKATLSRFASINWSSRKGSHDKTVIPDLWRNTAGILAQHPDFIEAAKKAGVWDRVVSIARASTDGRNR